MITRRQRLADEALRCLRDTGRSASRAPCKARLGSLIVIVAYTGSSLRQALATQARDVGQLLEQLPEHGRGWLLAWCGHRAAWSLEN